MTDVNPQSPSDEKQQTVGLLLGKWTGSEVRTLVAFVLLAWIGVRYGWELSWILTAGTCLVALRQGVRWPIVKMIPISLATFLSWGFFAYLIGWLFDQPNIVDNKAGDLFAMCITLLLPPIAVLPFAQPLRERMAFVSAFADKRVCRGLGALMVKGLIGLLGLTFFIWLIKNIWYAV